MMGHARPTVSQGLTICPSWRGSTSEWLWELGRKSCDNWCVVEPYFYNIPCTAQRVLS